MAILRTLTQADVPVYPFNVRCTNELCGRVAGASNLLVAERLAIHHLYQTGHEAVVIEAEP